jgi:hypothetical protein
VIETRGGDHLHEIVQAIRDKGFSVTILSDMSS